MKWMAFRPLALVFASIVTAGRGAIIEGAGDPIASNVLHPNGNIYDQVLLTGPAVTVRNDPGEITRVSFLDPSNDIIQVEFGGAGSLAVMLGNSSGPMPAENYNQAGVEYMRGLASVTISGSDATTNLTIFSVGTLTAVNQDLFRDDVDYDGYADIARITIVADPQNPNGATFGGIRTGNAHYLGNSGIVGINATNVHVQNVVRIGDVTAADDAAPTLVFGKLSQFHFLEVAGGTLEQPNGRSIQMDGFDSILMRPGASSHGDPLPIGVFLAAPFRLEREGVDVTSLIAIFATNPDGFGVVVRLDPDISVVPGG